MERKARMSTTPDLGDWVWLAHASFVGHSTLVPPPPRGWRRQRGTEGFYGEEGKGGQVQLRFLPSSFLPGKEDEAREEKEEGGGRGILPSVAFQSNGGWTEEGLQWWRGGGE